MRSTAVIARTRLDGRVVLKPMLIKPATTVDDLHEAVAHVTAAGGASLPGQPDG